MHPKSRLTFGVHFKIVQVYKSKVNPLTIKGKYGIIIVPRGSRTLPNGNECTSSKRQLEMPDVRDHEKIIQDYLVDAALVLYGMLGRKCLWQGIKK